MCKFPFHLLRFIFTGITRILAIMLQTKACWYHCIYLHYTLQHQRWITSRATALMYVRDRFTCKYMPFMNYAVNLLRTRGLSRKQYVGKLCSLCIQGYINCVLFVTKDTLMDCIRVEGRTTELEDKMLRGFWIPPDTTILRRELRNYKYRDIHWTSKK